MRDRPSRMRALVLAAVHARRGVSSAAGRVAVVFAGEPEAGRAVAPGPRLVPVLSALSELGLAVEPVAYGALGAPEVRDRLAAADGVLAWVDPVGPYGDRSRLDTALRAAAANGTWI